MSVPTEVEEVVCDVEDCGVVVDPFDQPHPFDALLCDVHVEVAFEEHEGDLMHDGFKEDV